jgi:hypothetical protein
MLCALILNEGFAAALPSGAGRIDERWRAKPDSARDGSHYTKMRTGPKPDARCDKIPEESPEVRFGRSIRSRMIVSEFDRLARHGHFTKRRFWGPPELDRRVVAARGEDGAVGRKRGGVHWRLVPAQGEKFSSGDRVPQANHAVISRRCDCLAIRRRRQGPHTIGVTAKCARVHPVAAFQSQISWSKHAEATNHLVRQSLAHDAKGRATRRWEVERKTQVS